MSRSEDRSQMRSVRNLIETVSENSSGSDRVTAISTVVREYFKAHRTTADIKADWADEYLQACVAGNDAEMDRLRTMGKEFGYIQ